MAEKLCIGRGKPFSKEQTRTTVDMATESDNCNRVKRFEYLVTGKPVKKHLVCIVNDTGVTIVVRFQSKVDWIVDEHSYERVRAGEAGLGAGPHMIGAMGKGEKRDAGKYHIIERPQNPFGDIMAKDAGPQYYNIKPEGVMMQAVDNADPDKIFCVPAHIYPGNQYSIFGEAANRKAWKAAGDFS